jgi:hypothetical protein
MYRNAIATLIAVIVMAVFHPAHPALLPPSMIDSVVALGAMVNTAPPGQPPKIEWATLGTGFFYGYKVHDDPDVTKRQYEVYLVTAGHVVSELKQSNKAIFLFASIPKIRPYRVKPLTFRSILMLRRTLGFFILSSIPKPQ